MEEVALEIFHLKALTFNGSWTGSLHCWMKSEARLIRALVRILGLAVSSEIRELKSDIARSCCKEKEKSLI